MRWRPELLCQELHKLMVEAEKAGDAISDHLSAASRKYDYDRGVLFNASGWTPRELSYEICRNPRLQMMLTELRFDEKQKV